MTGVRAHLCVECSARDRVTVSVSDEHQEPVDAVSTLGREIVEVIEHCRRMRGELSKLAMSVRCAGQPAADERCIATTAVELVRTSLEPRWVGTRLT